ncbi:MAG: hypothetical protein M1834_005514 [Cirrosporium novae-zelandiae]|nr:MAG: hypothetical protein M1834_005514 [Cirrosporium novae-zelandiae]
MDDDALAQFTSITGSSPELAQQYLHLTDGNLEQAVQLFFDSGGVDMGGSVAPTTQPSSHVPSNPNPTNINDPISIDSDNEISDDNDPEIIGYNPRAERPTVRANPGFDTPTSGDHTSMEDDEAMARRLQEEMYGGGAMDGTSADDVRAPIARTRETLVGPGADYGDDNMQAAVFEQIEARRRARMQTGRPGIFNQQAGSSSIWEDEPSNLGSRRQDLAEATGGQSESSSKASMLAEMYRPPFEIMSRLAWEDARDEGKSEEKWIIVNIQDASIFDCQILNRDIWKHPGVRDTIKENFIFMQYTKDDPGAQQYCQYYFQAKDSQDAYPHIAIVDPRTGEQMKVWSGPPVPKPMDFLMQLHEFLDRYSLNPHAKNPVARRKPEMKKETQIDRMTEEEMLELALQNSLAASKAADEMQREEDPDALTKSVSDMRSKGKGRATDAPPAAEVSGINGGSTQASASPFSRISSTNPHIEPSADPVTTTRIQFRHAGGRVIRRFGLNEPVRRIYEWLKSAPLEGKAGTEFGLVFMGKNLLESLDETIDHAGLKNGTVMLEFME